MNNEYTASEVIEIGKAQELILGVKDIFPVSDFLAPQPKPDNDLDD